MKTTTLFLLLFLSFTSFGQKNINCLGYQTGFFKLIDTDRNFTVYRDASHQIEYDFDTKEWVIVKLTWTSDCKYSFIYVSTNMSRLEHLIGHKMEVSIVDGDQTGYKYVASVKSTGEIFDGEMVLLLSELNFWKKRKLKRKLKQVK